MVQKPAGIRAWASWSGVGVTIVSAALLAVVLWQIVRLDAMGGIDPTALDRDRLAMRVAADVMATSDAVAQYRRVVFMNAEPMEVRALRNVVAARMQALGVLFGPGGEAVA